MDKDPLQSVEEALQIDDLKQSMYHSALLLLMNDDSRLHVISEDLFNGEKGSVPHVRNAVDREIGTKDNPNYDTLRKYGVEAVKLSYKPDRDNKLESVDGETVIMAVQNTNGTEHILKMRVENSGHLEEIAATSTAKLVDGVYLSDESSQFDLEEMQRIADAIERADS